MNRNCSFRNTEESYIIKSAFMAKVINLLYTKIFSFLICTTTFLSFCYLDFEPGAAKIAKALAVLFNSINIVIYLARKNYSKQSILLIIIFAVGLLSSFLGTQSEPINFVILYIRLIGFYLYLEIGISEKTTKTISVLSKTLWIMVFLNWVTLIIFPEGLYESSNYTNNWFFQYDNLHIMWYISAICISYINYKINGEKSKIGLISLLLMTTYGVFFCMSANSVVAYVMLLLYLVLSRYIDKIKFLNYKTYFVIFLILNISIVFLRVQNIFSWFIVGILGKTLTFTGRTIIWDRISKLISVKPLLGYGFKSSSTISAVLGNSRFTHAHNTILDIAYKGGVISSTLFTIFLWSLNEPIKKCADIRIRNFISFVLFCLLMMMVFEARQEKIGLYIVLAVASCASFLKRKNNE